VSLLDLIDEKRPEILRIAAKHGAHDVRLFGSVARGDDHEGSDVDLLADYKGWSTPLQDELKKLLGVKVDVVPYEMHPYMRERVLDEAIPLDIPDFRERAVIESQRPHQPMDRDRLHLLLMRDAIDATLEYAAAGHDAFDSQRIYRDAIVFQLSQIGEAANRISQELRQQHPEIPWDEMRGFRNEAIHNYPGLVMSEVWNTVEIDIPKLKSQLEKL
jgi:hypothetical protein